MFNGKSPFFMAKAPFFMGKAPLKLGDHHPVPLGSPGGVPATEHFVEVLDPEGQVRRWFAICREFFVPQNMANIWPIYG